MDLITDQNTFDDLLDKLDRQSSFALDTEFIREHTFRPELCLVQIAFGDTIVAVDPFDLDLSDLVDLIEDDEVEKIVHAGQQDMEIFYYERSKVPARIFDTQIAAAMLGYGDSIGYAKLVEQVLRVRPKKGETYTDWAKRPLTERQVRYALDDVRYLEDLRDTLLEQLEKSGRLDWCLEETQRYYRPEFYERDEGTAYKKVKGVGRLDASELAVLREVASWREVEAKKANRPRGRIVSDGLLIEVAQQKPDSVRRLGDIRGTSPRVIKKFGEEIVSLVARGQDCPKKDRPKVIEKPALPDGSTVVIDFLDLLVKLRADEHRISSGYLAARSELSTLVSRVLRDEDFSDLRIMSGWRRDLVGDQLVEAIRGNTSLSVDAKRWAIRVDERRS